MKEDRFGMPSAPYIPPPRKEPRRRISFGVWVVGWGFLLTACGFALIFLSIISESLVSP